jgi:hypothetical protein
MADSQHIDVNNQQAKNNQQLLNVGTMVAHIRTKTHAQQKDMQKCNKCEKKNLFANAVENQR